MRPLLVTLLLAALLAPACAARQQASAPHSLPLERRYIEGETAQYLMTGSHASPGRTFTYSAEAEATVIRDEQGRFIEEIRWTHLSVMGRKVPLDEFSSNFRQRLSLDGRIEPAPPAPEDIARINPMLIGPVFDLMTFYVDHYLAVHGGTLQRPGDHFHTPHGQPNSWADGTNTIIGEDCIDFEVKLRELSDTRASLSVRHVPPEETSVNLVAAWMHDPVVAGVPNNWVQVQRNSDPNAELQYVAAAGHEVFDVLIEIERPSGRIIKATMHNPVDLIQRKCKDASLFDCGEAERFQILRVIHLERRDEPSLVRPGEE